MSASSSVATRGRASVGGATGNVVIVPDGGASVELDQTQLHEVLHRSGDRELGEAEVVGDAAHGGASSDGDERRPANLVDRDLALRKRRAERHPRVHRRHHGLDGPPLVEERLGLGQEDLDVGRRGGVVVGGVGVEGEGAVLEAEELEESVDRLVGVGSVGGFDPHDLTGEGPDAAGASSASDPQPAGLLRGREEAQHIRQGEHVQSALQGQVHLR